MGTRAPYKRGFISGAAVPLRGLGPCLPTRVPVLSFSVAPVRLIYLKVCQQGLGRGAGRANNSFLSSLANRGRERRPPGDCREER